MWMIAFDEIFIDKTNKEGKVLLVDASNLGDKIKEGKTQRTVLRPEEIEKIVTTFANNEVVDDFSVLVDYDEIKEKNYSFSAGQYFEVKIEYVELTQEEFNNKMTIYKANLNKYFNENKILEDEINKSLEELKYES